MPSHVRGWLFVVWLTLVPGKGYSQDATFYKPCYPIPLSETFQDPNGTVHHDKKSTDVLSWHGHYDAHRPPA